MKMLPIFIYIILFASCHSNNNHKKAPLTADTVSPLYDTAIYPLQYSSCPDSVLLKHQRDSFYAIKPAYLFTSTANASAFNKLIAAAIDTTAAIHSRIDFTMVESYTYDKDSMPLSRTVTYSGKDYKIQVLTTDLEEYKQKLIFINNRRLKWGADIDTSLTGTDISYTIELSPADFSLLEFNGKKFLYIQGGIEKCNGNGCGVSYHLIYDLQLHKAVALQQYRTREFYMGKLSSGKQLAFLVFADHDFNYLYQHFTVSAKTYLFSNNGKILAAKYSRNKQYYFDGYSTGDPDRISILTANFP